MAFTVKMHLQFEQLAKLFFPPFQSLSLHKYSSFERNEPSSLAATCELIAAFMDMPADELARITTENADRVFRLELGNGQAD